jgi:uncharacterized membrane protein
MAYAPPADIIEIMETQLRISPDIPAAVAVFIVAIVAIAIVHLGVTGYRKSAPKTVVAFGVLGYLALLTALLRPISLKRTGRTIGPKMAILVDASRRLRLASHAQSRASSATTAVGELLRKYPSARVDLATFGEHGVSRLREVAQLPSAMNSAEASDLTAALESLVDVTGEPPVAVFLLTDGRWSRPDSTDAVKRELPASLKGVPIYGVDVGGDPIPDASIRSLDGLGHAVAHQSLAMRIGVYCGGGLSCREIPITVREFEKGRQPREIAQSVVNLSGKESSAVDINVTFERAGIHILKVSLAAQAGDRVPENDARYIVFDVTRERIRLLHIAGSPSYDVRELRRWLKGSASVDLVSFFILRTDEDEPNTAENSTELSLIPFPVDELFDRHLPSFDGVVLQDIDAARYHLDVHLDQLARYVEEGGGLVLVGGPAAFGGGAYAHSALERVLPTTMVVSHMPFDSVEFVPVATSTGLQSPMLAPLRRLLGERLPSFPGANTLGPPKSDARVLWVHPSRTFLPVKGQSTLAGPMPVLAIREVNEGRTVALALDATYRLAWGQLAAESSGRAYGAFWEAMIGWVMHEARFEPFRGELAATCVEGVPASLKWMVPAGTTGQMAVQLEALDGVSSAKRDIIVPVSASPNVEVVLGALKAGAYTASARMNGGLAARIGFACEAGGAALSDSRPDSERLRRLTSVAGGYTVSADRVAELPALPSTFVDHTRTSKPLAPAWVWALVAAALLGTSWLSARSYGMR